MIFLNKIIFFLDLLSKHYYSLLTGGVAPKLIDVRPDVVQKQDLFKSSVTNNALEALTPENGEVSKSLGWVSFFNHIVILGSCSSLF